MALTEEPISEAREGVTSRRREAVEPQEISKGVATRSDREPAPISNRYNVLVLTVAFACSFVLMGVIFYNFPELDEEDFSRLKLPRTIEDAKDVGRLLSKYKDTHYFTVLAAVVSTYVFLQTFAIPGSISLSILSGFLFPFPLALLLVCTCSALGATLCYSLSAMVGSGIVRKYFPQRLSSWRQQAARHDEDMLWYMIFLRITPFLPNWFINVASPVIGVRLAPFYWGTFLGVAPPSFFFIRAGTTLYQLTTATGHISLHSLLILSLFALLSLTPVFLKKAIRKKMQ